MQHPLFGGNYPPLTLAVWLKRALKSYHPDFSGHWGLAHGPWCDNWHSSLRLMEQRGAYSLVGKIWGYQQMLTKAATARRKWNPCSEEERWEKHPDVWSYLLLFSGTMFPFPVLQTDKPAHLGPNSVLTHGQIIPY